MRVMNHQRKRECPEAHLISDTGRALLLRLIEFHALISRIDGAPESHAP